MNSSISHNPLSVSRMEILLSTAPLAPAADKKQGITKEVEGERAKAYGEEGDSKVRIP